MATASEETVLDTRFNRYQASLTPSQTEPQPAAPSADTPAPPAGPDAWAAKVRGFGLDAPVGSDTWRAAILLVASLDTGHNVDRIARRTGAPRPFVAKCARRLVDNGVWTGEGTVGAWTSDPGAGDAFRRDVAVAEGRMQRRSGEGGVLEWAAAGNWTKSFERESEDLGLCSSYNDTPDRPDHPVPLASELKSGRKPVGVKTDLDAGNPVAARLEDVEPALTAPPKLPPAVKRPVQRREKVAAEPAPTPSLEEVFRDAVWLR